MSYLSQLKAKLEKQDESNNAALMGEDFIKEADEYSEETHSDDGVGGGGNNKKHGKKYDTTSSKKSKGDESENSKKDQTNLQKEIQDWKKRIAQMLQ